MGFGQQQHPGAAADNPAHPIGRTLGTVTNLPGNAFTLAIVALLLINNLAGRFIYELDLPARKGKTTVFGVRGQWKHGWPWTFVTRSSQFRGSVPNRIHPFDASVWTIWAKLERFAPTALAADGLCAVGFLFLGTRAFAAWTYRRRRLFQLTLREMVALIAMFGAVFAWLASERHGYVRELRALDAIDIDAQDDPDPPHSAHTRVVWAPGGPSWLRQLLGNSACQWCDRVAQLNVEDGRDVKHVLRFRHLRSLRIDSCHLNPDDVERLAELPILEALCLVNCLIELPTDEMIELDGPAYHADPLFTRLRKLTRLRALNLEGSEVTGRAVADLASLSRLEALDLSESDMDDEGMRAIEAMHHLRELWLVETRVTNAGLRYLSKLDELRTLRLDMTRVGDAGLEALVGLRNLQELGLSGTDVTDVSLETLKALASLQYLDLTATGVTAAAIGELRHSIPSCEVVPSEKEGM